MPVESQHAHYADHKAQWKRCRDAYKGSDAIKKAGTDYLPKMSGQDTDRYDAYKDRAGWLSATKRTVQGLHGAIFRKDPSLTIPDKLEPFMRDVTLRATSLDSFASKLTSEILQVGRVGIFVDYSETHQRPRLSRYDTEQIINWRTKVVDGELVLQELRLSETAMMPDPDDPWSEMGVPQIRVFRLDAEGKLEGVVFRQAKAGEGEFEEVPDLRVAPTRRGERLDFIPFIFVNPSNHLPEVEEPPLLGLVDVNIAHYRNDAILQHGLERCGVPQLWARGWEFPETTSEQTGGEEGQALSDKIPLSADYILYTESQHGHMEYAEFEGKGLSELREDLREKKQEMAMLGAQILEEAKAGVEAAAAIQLRHAGEKSALGGMASAVDEGITRALGIFAWWAGEAEDRHPPEDVVNYTLTKDYVASRMEPQMLTALTAALQAGTIDFQTYAHNLEQGELLIPGQDVEEMLERIQTQAPTFRPAEASGSFDRPSGDDGDGGDGASGE